MKKNIMIICLIFLAIIFIVVGIQIHNTYPSHYYLNPEEQKNVIAKINNISDIENIQLLDSISESKDNQNNYISYFYTYHGKTSFILFQTKDSIKYTNIFQYNNLTINKINFYSIQIDQNNICLFGINPTDQNLKAGFYEENSSVEVSLERGTYFSHIISSSFDNSNGFIISLNNNEQYKIIKCEMEENYE
ncbi:MAG: hypothetical protein ACLUVC_04660 [Longibaculum sp.]